MPGEKAPPISEIKALAERRPDFLEIIDGAGDQIAVKLKGFVDGSEEVMQMQVIRDDIEGGNQNGDFE